MEKIAAKNKFRGKWLSMLKWMILLSAMGYLISSASWRDYVAELGKLSISTVFIFCGFSLLSRILYAIRWSILCKQLLVAVISPFFLFRTNLLAELFSLILFTSGAGEVVKVAKLSKYSKKITLSVISIGVDRFIGLSALIVLVFLIVLRVGKEFVQISLPRVSLLLFILFLILVLVLTSLTVIIRSKNQYLRKAMEIVNQLKLEMMFVAFVLTAIGHLLMATGYFYLFREVHTLSYLTSISLVLVSQLARLIPVNFLGISGSEAVFIALSGLYGVSREDSMVIVSIVVFSVYIFAGLGVLFELLIDGKLPLRGISETLGNSGDEIEGNQ